MFRPLIQIARIRAADVREGDVVNGRPDNDQGWFEVLVVRRLTSGELVLAGAATAQSIKAAPNDLVGLQVVKLVELATNERAAAPSASVDVRTGATLVPGVDVAT